MNIKVLSDRNVVKETYLKPGTQYDNYASVLNFEFPEYVEKDGEQISTSELNKYIVFDTNGSENTDIILNNKYILKSNITKLKEIKACIYLKQPSESEDIDDKLVWVSKTFTLNFNAAIKENLQLTQEDIDAFNVLYSEFQTAMRELEEIKKEYEDVTILILDEEE